MRETGSRLAAVLLAVFLQLAVAIVLDVRIAGVRPINERPPGTAPVDLMRTAIVLTAALTFVGGIVLVGAAPRGRR